MNKLFLLSALIVSVFFQACKEKQVQQAAPLEVTVTKVLQQHVDIVSEYTGQTYGQADIQINPRIDGTILSQNFREGSLVTKGQLLYTIDPLPFQAKVSEAEAKVADAQAQLGKAKSDLDMVEPLAKINAVSQRELVAAKSAYEAAQARIQAAQASLQNAKIQLGYCQIKAPIAGLIGMSKVRVGDYVTPGPMSVLNTISDMNDIRVRFTISEQEFLRIFREVNSDNSTLKNTGDSISLKLSDGTLYPHIGQISFADREIDPTTGAITFEAAFPNPDKMLRPGQFVKVLVVTNIRKDALVIPQRAVIEMQGIYQVYMVTDSNKVQLNIIKTGPAIADGYVVDEGLKAGDKIAFGGTNMLRNGSFITPKMVDWKPGQKAQ